jgi:hypothetical protein
MMRLTARIVLAMSAMVLLGGCATHSTPVEATATDSTFKASPASTHSTALKTGSAAPSASSSPRPTTPSQLPHADFLGPITAPVEYKNVNINLDPPSATAHAAISPDAAYAKCLTPDAECQTNLNPTITLALVTTPKAGTRSADGSISPLMDHQLAYIIEYDQATCTKSGPPVVSNTAPPHSEMIVYICSVLNFVNADTGRVEYSVSSTHL